MSCFDGGRVVIRGGGLFLLIRETASMVAVNEAPNEPPIEMMWLRKKPLPKPIISTPYLN